MDQSMIMDLSFLTVTCCIISLSFLIQILIKGAKTGKNKNPPEPKGAWPIIGHLHLLGGSVITQRVLSDMAETWGPIFTLKPGVHEALVVSDAEIAKECLTTHDKVFASRPKSKAAEIMVRLCSPWKLLAKSAQDHHTWAAFSTTSRYVCTCLSLWT